MQAHKELERYRDGSADTCAHGLSSVVDMPKRSAKRNTDEANARPAYERADENPFVWRPSVERLPDKRLTKPAFVWLVPTSDGGDPHHCGWRGWLEGRAHTAAPSSEADTAASPVGVWREMAPVTGFLTAHKVNIVQAVAGSGVAAYEYEKADWADRCVRWEELWPTQGQRSGCDLGRRAVKSFDTIPLPMHGKTLVSLHPWSTLILQAGYSARLVTWLRPSAASQACLGPAFTRSTRGSFQPIKNRQRLSQTPSQTRTQVTEYEKEVGARLSGRIAHGAPISGASGARDG